MHAVHIHIHIRIHIRIHVWLLLRGVPITIAIRGREVEVEIARDGCGSPVSVPPGRCSGHAVGVVVVVAVLHLLTRAVLSCLLASLVLLSCLAVTRPYFQFSQFAFGFLLSLINDALLHVLFIRAMLYVMLYVVYSLLCSALLIVDGAHQRDSEIAPPEGLYLACDVRYRYRYRCSVHGGHENQHRCQH